MEETQDKIKRQIEITLKLDAIGRELTPILIRDLWGRGKSLIKRIAEQGPELN